MMRTLELKSRQKKRQYQYQSGRTLASNTVHRDDDFAGVTFYTNQESFNNDGVKGEINGVGANQLSKVQQRQAFTQRLIQRNL
jgi:hypothetical protein